MKKVKMELIVEGTTDQVDTFCEWFANTVGRIEAPIVRVDHIGVVSKDPDPAEILESLKATLADAKAKQR